MAKAELMDSDDDQHFNLKDFSSYIANTVSKGRELALNQMKKVQDQITAENAKLPKGQKKPSSAYPELIRAAQKDQTKADDGMLASPATEYSRDTTAELDQESQDLIAQRAGAVGGLVPQPS